MKRSLSLFLVFIFSILILKNSFYNLSGSNHCDEIGHIHKRAFGDLAHDAVNSLSANQDDDESQCHEGKANSPMLATDFDVVENFEFPKGKKIKLNFSIGELVPQMEHLPNRRPPKVVS